MLEWQLCERTCKQRRVPREIAGHAGHQGAHRFEAEGRTVETRALALRDGGERQLAVLQRKLRRESENGGWRCREQRVFFVAYRHLSRRREQRIGAVEGDQAEIVVDLIIRLLVQHTAIERHALRVGTHLNGAQLDGLRTAAAFGQIAGQHAVDRLRPLRRIQVFVGIAVQRVVGGIGEWPGESAAGERLYRRVEHEIVADQLLLPVAAGERGQLVRIVGTWPHAIFDVEGSRVGGLRKSEQLQIGFAPRRIDGLFLIARCAGHEFELDRLPLQLLAAESVYRLEFTQKVRAIGGLQLGLPEQVRELRIGGELDVRRAAGVHVASRGAVHRYFVRDGQPLVVRIEGAHERNPELRRIDVVVDVLAQHFINLSRRVAGTAHGELRTARILIGRADELPVHVQPGRSHRIGERRRQLLHLLPIQQVDVGVSAKHARVDGEEEAPRFDLDVFDDAIDLLLRAFTDGEDIVLGHVALLLRHDRGEAHGADLSGGLNTVVARGDARGEKARGWRLEGDIAHFKCLQRFVGLALIAHGDVVRRIEFALRVVVDIHVDAVGDDAAGPHIELKVERRLKDAEAVVAEDRELRGGASLVATALHLRLETRVEVDAEVTDVVQQVGGELGGGIGADPTLGRQWHERPRGGAAIDRGVGDRRARCRQAANHRLLPTDHEPLRAATTGIGHDAIGDAGRIWPQRRGSPERAQDWGDPKPQGIRRQTRP